MSTGKYKGKRNPRGMCSKCAAPVTWLRTAENKWIPVNDREGRVNPADVFSPTVHAAHRSTCPASQEFKAQQAAKRAAADAANPELLEATRKLMEARKELEAKWAAAADQVQPRPEQQRVIAQIGAVARELGKVYGIRRDQLQGLAKATVGVSSFEHLYAVPVTWLEEKFLYALKALYTHIWACDAEGLDNGPSTEIWDNNVSQFVQAVEARFASRCEERNRAAGVHL